jgi:predicted transposase YdaD
MTAKNNITKPHDAFTKANLADIDRIKALTKSHYSKEIVSLIEFDTFENKPTEFIQRDLRHIACDVLYSCKIKDEDGYIYFLYEPQSTPDELTVLLMSGIFLPKPWVIKYRTYKIVFLLAKRPF